MKEACLAFVLLAMGNHLAADTIEYRLSTTGSLGRAIVAEGTRTYSPETDVEIRKTDAGGSSFWSKRVELSHGFKLEAHVTREATLDGFGLVVTSPASPDDFSWNWFDRENGPVFAKLRGSGRLKVTERKVGALTELASIEFLDDVALTYRDDKRARTRDERTHELLIKKGSVFRMAR